MEICYMQSKGMNAQAGVTSAWLLHIMDKEECVPLVRRNGEKG